jgi:hypothetical protein
MFEKGRKKTGGRKKGVRNKRTLAVLPRQHPNALDYLAEVVADDTLNAELRVRAATGLAVYQHPKPFASRVINPAIADFPLVSNASEATTKIAEVTQRMARGEIDTDSGHALIDGLKIFVLGYAAVELEMEVAKAKLREEGER